MCLEPGAARTEVAEDDPASVDRSGLRRAVRGREVEGGRGGGGGAKEAG